MSNSHQNLYEFQSCLVHKTGWFSQCLSCNIAILIGQFRSILNEIYMVYSPCNCSLSRKATSCFSKSWEKIFSPHNTVQLRHKDALELLFYIVFAVLGISIHSINASCKSSWTLSEASKSGFAFPCNHSVRSTKETKASACWNNNNNNKKKQ